MLGYPRRLKRRVVPVVEWLLEVGDGTDDAVEYHLARCDAVAQSNGGVLGVGFVYVGEDVGKLGAVVGDLEDVELCLANEVGDVSGCVGDVAWLVEPGGSVLRQAQDRFLRLCCPFDGAQDRPFDGAQDRPSLRMSGVLLSRWLRRDRVRRRASARVVRRVASIRRRALREAPLRDGHCGQGPVQVVAGSW